MRKPIINTLIIGLITGLITLIIPTTVNAQLFEENELFPNVKTIKGKYFNVSGGKGWRSLDYVDSLGRVTMKESYHKRQLMSRHEIEYDDHNNEILSKHTFDINDPQKINSCRYAYKYSGDRIVYQCLKCSANDSTVIELKENLGDSVLVYQEKAFYYRPTTGNTHVYETVFTLKYKNGLLTSKEIYKKEGNSKVIETYEYFANGRLQHRIIERIPKPAQKSTYIGAPGSDDEYYKYIVDSKGRVKKFFKIIEGKKFRMVAYNYV